MSSVPAFCVLCLLVAAWCSATLASQSESLVQKSTCELFYCEALARVNPVVIKKRREGTELGLAVNWKNTSELIHYF